MRSTLCTGNSSLCAEATKTALRDLQTMQHDASFNAQKVQFLLDSIAQNDIIKLFSVIVFMPVEDRRRNN
jgi:hypothetical protein